MVRRNKSQIAADKIIKAKLLILGGDIFEESTKTSRVAKDTFYKDGSLNKKGGSLRDSQNFRVIKDTTLEVGQLFYGQYNFPKGFNGGEKNALFIAVKKLAPETTSIIISEINDQILAPFKTKRQ